MQDNLCELKDSLVLPFSERWLSHSRPLSLISQIHQSRKNALPLEIFRYNYCHFNVWHKTAYGNPPQQLRRNPFLEEVLPQATRSASIRLWSDRRPDAHQSTASQTWLGYTKWISTGLLFMWLWLLELHLPPCYPTQIRQTSPIQAAQHTQASPMVRPR